MKRYLAAALVLLALLCLASCNARTKEEPTIPVSMTEGVHFTLEDNGFSVEPGDDVAFTLHLDDGYSVTAVHYDGPSAITNYGTSARVTLKNVRFPTRVSVEVAGHFRTVIYDPNGAGGEAVSRVYNLETKPRPNVSIGTDIFERPGFVLESWNTQPDGSGERIGLGSRMTVDEDREYRLYAQWARWTDPGLFTFAQTEEGLEVKSPSQSPRPWRGRPLRASAPGPSKTFGAWSFPRASGIWRRGPSPPASSIP